jgi:hypothetical protein
MYQNVSGLSAPDLQGLKFIEQFVKTLLHNLMKTEALSNLIPDIIWALMKIPNYKPDIVDTLRSFKAAAVSVQSLKITSDIDFFTQIVYSMKQSVPESAKRVVLGLISITPEESLHKFRTVVEQDSGATIITNIEKVISEFEVALESAKSVVNHSTPNASAASSGGYRKKSRKAKKSRKSKRTHRR